MNITNKGKKIVNIGELVLLPGKTAPLPKNFEGNPVVGFLIERGTLSCDQPFCSAAPETPLNDDAADDTGDDAGDDGLHVAIHADDGRAQIVLAHGRQQVAEERPAADHESDSKVHHEVERAPFQADEAFVG